MYSVVGCQFTVSGGVGRFGGFVNGLGCNEAQAVVQADRACVLGGDLEKDAADSGAAKSVQAVQQQASANALIAVFGRDAQILNCPQARLIANALDRAAIFRFVLTIGE